MDGDGCIRESTAHMCTVCVFNLSGNGGKCNFAISRLMNSPGGRETTSHAYDVPLMCYLRDVL